MGEERIQEDRLDYALTKYIKDGKVDYSSLKEDKSVEDYVKWLEGFEPETLETKDEKVAFWINTYNILTIFGVLQKLKKDPSFAEKGHSSFFRRFRFFWWKKYKIGRKKYSLYQIENKILREKFAEPRIHFALNCASQSCPLLKDGLYSGKNLQKELDMATTLFMRSARGVTIDRENKILYLSSIFKWYKEDFEKSSGTIIEFVKNYLTDEDRKFVEDNSSEIKIRYQDYDWGLNVAEKS